MTKEEFFEIVRRNVKSEKHTCFSLDCFECPYSGENICLLDVNGIKDLVLENYDLKEKTKWIPCSEKLPDTSGSYLCTCSDGHTNRVTMLTFLKRLKAWNLTGTRAYWKVLAWMPLPDAYGGD